MAVVTLEYSKLFSQLPPREMETLRQAAEERSFTKNQEVFKEGSSGDGVYMVKEGLVQITGLIGQSNRHVFSEVGPGDVFGEMAVLESKPRSANATAVKDTVVYFIPRTIMLAMVERSPQLSLNLLREISARLREFNRQYIREVLQSERISVVGKFARSIIHDLKNPLNIISLSAEMASAPDASPETREMSNVYIRKQVERINDMVGEILEFTQGGTATLGLAPTSYPDYVHQVVDELSPETSMKNVQILLENEPPPIKLLMNPKRLRRVFHSLIHNAVDFLPDGGKITLRFKTTPSEIITEIQDTGPGISPEIADKLFEAFATHGKAHGTGLGLSICKKTMEDHSGHIFAKNAPEGGAIFTLTMPLPKL